MMCEMYVQFQIWKLFESLVLFCWMFYCVLEWEDKFSENWLARSKLRNGLFLSTCVGVCVCAVCIANERLW